MIGGGGGGGGQARKRARDDDDNYEGVLGIPEHEMFDLFQRQRWKIHSWLKANPPTETQDVMEAVVRVVTLTGTRTRPNDGIVLKPRKWRSMEGRNCDGRYIPESAPAKQPDGKDAKSGGGDSKKPAGSDKRNLLDSMARSVDTEINIQLGDFTLKTSTLDVLEDYITSLPDFTAVFKHDPAAIAHNPTASSAGEDKNNKSRDRSRSQQQTALTAATGGGGGKNQHGTGSGHHHHPKMGPIPCANIKMTTHREHYRLVGRRFDVLYWKPDDRSPPRALFQRPYVPQQLDDNERWIAVHLEPSRAMYLGSGSQLFLPTAKYDANATHAILVCYHDVPMLPIPGTPAAAAIAANGDSKDAKVPVPTIKVMREVVVFKNPKLIHVYTVIEHGRRFYRSVFAVVGPAFAWVVST